jgi:polar amino acid transport system substrate-binding protein
MAASSAPLRCASAFPDPPFEVEGNGVATGFDADLMQAVCRLLGRPWQLVRYTGDDFNGIFAGLRDGRYDAVVSGTTITPERRALALFSSPYLEFAQGLIVNRVRTPPIASAAELRGQTVGIQTGNTSDAVARRLLAQGAIGRIQYYPYDGIERAIDDLVAGRIGAIVKLFPVAVCLARPRPELAVVQQIPTHEQLGIAFARDNRALCEAVNGALLTLKQDGTFEALCQKWLPEH